MDTETRPRNPQRQNTAQELEKLLGQRPPKEDLQNRNILKGERECASTRCGNF